MKIITLKDYINYAIQWCIEKELEQFTLRAIDKFKFKIELTIKMKGNHSICVTTPYGFQCVRKSTEEVLDIALMYYWIIDSKDETICEFIQYIEEQPVSKEELEIVKNLELLKEYSAKNTFRLLPIDLKTYAPITAVSECPDVYECNYANKDEWEIHNLDELEKLVYEGLYKVEQLYKM